MWSTARKTIFSNKATQYFFDIWTIRLSIMATVFMLFEWHEINVRCHDFTEDSNDSDIILKTSNETQTKVSYIV